LKGAGASCELTDSGSALLAVLAAVKAIFIGATF
jgi:hypothetical protein